MDEQCLEIDKELKSLQRILDSIVSSEDSIYRLQSANEFAAKMQIIQHKLTDTKTRSKSHWKVQQRLDSLHQIVQCAIRQFADNPLVSRQDLSVSTLSLGEMSPLLTNPHCSPYPLLTPAVN